MTPIRIVAVALAASFAVTPAAATAVDELIARIEEAPDVVDGDQQRHR